jgi:hypothetical protein
MRFAISVLVSLSIISQSVGVAQDDAGTAAKKRLEIYNFASLVTKADRIVVADVGTSKDGVVALVVRETLKAPETDAKSVDAARLKRAADLLANEKLNLPPLPKAPQNLTVVPENLKLPGEGTQAIFFLWDSMGEGKYRLAHPQCIYDLELLPQVRVGAARPRSVADGRFLRDWDKQMAEKLRQRDSEDELVKMKGGEEIQGLKLTMLRPALSLRGNNSFSVTAQVENTRTREQCIYDGPAGGFGVILRPKNGNDDTRPIVLRQSTKDIGADNAVLNIADMTDFSIVRANAAITRELYFDGKEIPALRQLNGEYLVRLFFITQQDGRGLDLDAPVWTGSLVSEDKMMKFGTSK